MAITNGLTIDKADLDAMLTTSLALLQADGVRPPAGLEQNVYFNNLVAGTARARRRFTFIAPCDLLLETLAVQAVDFTAASSLSVGVGSGTTDDDDELPLMVDDIDDTTSLASDGIRATWPVKVTGTVGAGATSLSRLLFDGTKAKLTRPATTSRAVRVFLKGSTIHVSASTTSIATPSRLQVCLVMRELWGRDGS
jgi:hypothetical protein